jgi:hypothetical protein
VTYLASSAGAIITDRNTWRTNANTAYDSGVWGSGNHWHTNANTAYQSGTWGSGNTWHYNADQAWGPSRVWSSGNSFETNYNNQLAAYNSLLGGLNSPEGLQSQGFAISHNAGGTEVGIGTFTFGRAGHFLVAVICPISAPNVSQNNASTTLRLAGVVAMTQTANIGTQAGASRNWWHAGAWDVDVSAGATISLFFNAFVTGNPTTGTATVYAHFVPNATYHN